MPPAERIPVVIDTDPGVDDAVTILAALASPALDVRAISVVHGNIELDQAVANARRVVTFSGRRDVPIHAGTTRPLLRTPMRGKFHGTKGLGPLALPEPEVAVEAEHSVDLLARLLRAAVRGEARKLTLCAIGPRTNVALALAKEPELAGGLERIVLMGGAFREGGNRTATAEFNILADPHAAQIVFASGAPIVMAPLDVTHRAMATPERVAALRARGGRIAEAVADLLAFFDRKDPARYGTHGAPVHDPTVIAWLLRPELFEARRTYVEVCCQDGIAFGQTVADWWGTTGKAPNADVLVGIDADGFFELLGSLLARYPAA